MTEAKHTPGPWEWADEPGAGIQIRGPYKGSTRLLFSDIWRKFPEREWDAEMAANAKLAASAPELLKALLEAEAALECALDRLKSAKPADYAFHVTSEYVALEVVRAAIAKATE